MKIFLILFFLYLPWIGKFYPTVPVPPDYPPCDCSCTPDYCECICQ